jgi:hypothetical protein
MNSNNSVLTRVGDVWRLVRNVNLARQRGDLYEAERLQRRLIEHTTERWGTRDVVTAAALFDLVMILEQQEGREAESIKLRLMIKDILNTLPKVKCSVKKSGSLCAHRNYPTADKKRA